MAAVVTFNPLALRRSVMLGQKTGGGVNGWTKTVYTATADTLKGNTTTAAILAAIPSGFRYAVAIADDISAPENNAFIGGVFLPGVAKVLGFRWASNNYTVLSDMENSNKDIILRSGASVNIWTRTEPLADDVPVTDWNYYCLKPGAVAKANELSAVFSSIGTYSAMLSVADRDYNTAPEANNAYCESATKNSDSFIGVYMRYRNGAYASGASWGAAYDIVTDNTTKIACFYI